MPQFKVRNLSFTYKKKPAVNHINIDINNGDLVAFLGPNGAGKSTTMRMLTGLTTPTTGTVSLNGISAADPHYDHLIGITFQGHVLDDDLTVKQNLKLRFKMYHHLDPSFIKELVMAFGLTTLLNQRYGTLSGGQKRKVDITRSLINKPKLLLLDEPTTGLDLQTRMAIWHVLHQLRHKYQLSILLTTHYLEEANQADYAYVIDHGSIIAHDTMDDLRNKYAGYVLTLTSSKINAITKLINPKWEFQANHDHVKIIVPNLKSGITFLNQVKDLVSNVSYRRGDRCVNGKGGSIMLSLIQRDLLLYFKNKSRIFFSLIGALIGFFLYLIFLQNTIKSGWSGIPGATKLLDWWLISGVLTITAITTTLNALCQMIRDRESYRINDLMLTDQSNSRILLSYVVSAVIIGTLMQLASFIIMEVYFQWANGIHFKLWLLPKVLGVMIISSLVWTAFGTLILSFVHHVESLGLINTIINAAAGFFVCVYIPMGKIPASARNFIKCTPAPYNVAIYRKIFMKAQLNQSFENVPGNIFYRFENSMGINLKWNVVLSMPKLVVITLTFGIIFGVLAIPLLAVNRRRKVR